jgi:hypothetical protein
MSTLLEQASLVLIPSGYKEDVVYSQIPTNGNGDLSFTRASNGTRVNSAGLVEVTPWNLVQYSEDFAQAGPIWNKYQATITSNATTAPNGTLTADSITDNTSNDVHIAYQDMAGIVAGTYTISVYAKASTLSHINLQWYSGSAFYTSNAFNLSNGTTTGANQSIESVGNGWYRCIFTFTTTVSGLQYPYIMTNNGTSNVYVGTGQSVFIWGCQLNIGATAKPYFPTTDRLNVPRLTYQNGGGGCPSLLLEKQSTNYCLWSEDFTTTWSLTNTIATANQTTSPDGTQNADKLSDTNGTGQHRYFQNVLTGLTNQTLSFSIYAKQGTHRYISWGVTDDTDYRGQVVVDLQTGTITDQFTASATLSNLSVVSQGNGWYKISGTIAVSANWAGGNAYAFGLMLNSSSWSTAGYTGNNTNFYIWGAQVEQSSYPTSYIPTTSSSATRVADACFKTGISSLIGQTSGSVFFDFTVDSVTQPGDPVLWYMKDGGAGERYVELYSNGNLVYAEIDGSGPIATITKSSLTVGRHKCAIAYATNDFVFYVDGVQIGTDTSGTPNGFSTFGLQYYLSVYTGQQKVNQAAIFKTRLTNAELASLTTI